MERPRFVLPKIANFRYAFCSCHKWQLIFCIYFEDKLEFNNTLIIIDNVSCIYSGVYLYFC